MSNDVVPARRRGGSVGLPNRKTFLVSLSGQQHADLMRMSGERGISAASLIRGWIEASAGNVATRRRAKMFFGEADALREQAMPPPVRRRLAG